MCVCVYTLVYQEEMFLERSEMSARVAGMVFIFLVVEFFFYQVFVLFFFLSHEKSGINRRQYLTNNYLHLSVIFMF